MHKACSPLELLEAVVEPRTEEIASCYRPARLP